VVINQQPPAAAFVEVKGTRVAVATEDLRCSEVGVQAITRGGSATDAAIAAALCIGVLHPFCMSPCCSLSLLSSLFSLLSAWP